jgi:hypothetical protein
MEKSSKVYLGMDVHKEAMSWRAELARRAKASEIAQFGNVGHPRS